MYAVNVTSPAEMLYWVAAETVVGSEGAGWQYKYKFRNFDIGIILDS